MSFSLSVCQISGQVLNCFLKRTPIKLRRLFRLKEYLLHLQDHRDVIGTAMQLRFSEVDENPFVIEEELDALAPSPSSLCTEGDFQNTEQFTSQYGIRRVLHHLEDSEEGADAVVPTNQHYICHWKNILLNSGIIDSSSLSFQEDEALIYSVLHYPDPMPDWTLYGTLYLYAMKVYSSLPSRALNLHRGMTYNRLTTKPEALPNLKDYVRNINHACPSISAVQSNMPSLRYDNRSYHSSEILFHIKTLERSEDSFKLKFSPAVTRYPVTGGIDEQEINQGAFIENGMLCGLREKMSPADIRRIGLKELPTYICKNNPFIIAVREYRLTDFSGIFCSNSMTSFEWHVLTSVECIEQMDDLVAFAIQCEHCLKFDKVCKYDRIDQPCDECISSGECCVSLVVFHINWDMGSSHKKTVKENPSCLNGSNDIEKMMNPMCYTIGFGGLHLCKAFVNSIRNHVVQHNGEYFGTDILIALRNQCASLQNIKNAVFVGKDRQSDLLSWLTVCSDVRDALSLQEDYCMQRLPEKFLPYKKGLIPKKGDICC